MLRVVRSSPSSPMGATRTYFTEGPASPGGASLEQGGSPSPPRRREAPLGGLMHARSLDSPLAQVAPPAPAAEDVGPPTTLGAPQLVSPVSGRTRGGVYNMMAGVGSLWRQRLSRRGAKEGPGVVGGEVLVTPAPRGGVGGSGGEVGHTPETVYYLQVCFECVVTGI